MQKGAYFGEYFSEENRQRVRRIRILLDVEIDGEADLNGTKLIAGFEDAVLARMTKIEIVAALPRLSRKYPDVDQVEIARKRWLERFEELIKYIAGVTSPTLIIEVDDNGQEQTRAIVNRYLGTRCRAVLTDSGDLYFRRRAK